MNDVCFHFVQETFDIREESHNYVLKSAGAKWRQFKANLTKKHVLPYVGQKKKLRRPPKQYGFVGRGAWKRFVAERTAADWKVYIYIYVFLVNLYVKFFF